MNRMRAMKIHAFHDAAASLTIYFTATFFALVLALRTPLGDAVAMTAAALAFFAIMASVATDMMSKRIPDKLSLLLLASAPVWWLGAALGADLGTQNTGIARDLLSWVSPVYGTGPLIGPLSIPYVPSIIMDVLGMIVVFIPLFLSFKFQLGFGGGDVKLITAGSLFFGWSLGFDFLVVSFLIGGIFSSLIILGRSFFRIALRCGVDTDRVRRIAKFREFPYAPAIAVSAILCLACKLEGLI